MVIGNLTCSSRSGTSQLISDHWKPSHQSQGKSKLHTRLSRVCCLPTSLASFLIFPTHHLHPSIPRLVTPGPFSSFRKSCLPRVWVKPFKLTLWAASIMTTGYTVTSVYLTIPHKKYHRRDPLDHEFHCISRAKYCARQYGRHFISFEKCEWVCKMIW